jgi:glycerophosphoryl diester phosphodiesterase
LHTEELQALSPKIQWRRLSRLAAIGADGIELDVQMAKDGRLVVIHDEKLDRTTSLKGYVKDLTYKEIKRGDASHRFSEKTGSVPVPTLEEVFEWAADAEFLLNVELKNSIIRYEGMEEKVRRCLKRTAFKTGSFFHHLIMKALRYAAD